MTHMKNVVALVGVALAASSLASTPAAAQHYRHRDRDRYDQHRHHRRDHHRHGDGGSALAAGALGFILGAAIADTSSHRDYARGHMTDQAWLKHCETKYRSFDRGSGTYLGYDGNRHYCR